MNGRYVVSRHHHDLNERERSVWAAVIYRYMPGFHIVIITSISGDNFDLFHPKNELPVIVSLYCAQISGIATGQTLQLARGKSMAKAYSDVQIYDFGERLSLFRRCFIRNGFG